MRFVAALCALLCTAASADFAVVSRVAIVKDAPESDAEPLHRAQPGDNLILVDPDAGQQNGYYEVFIPGGFETGFVHRTRVRLREGDPPPDLADSDDAFAARHLRLGRPRSEVLLVREGYVAGVDARLKIPAWVQYELSVDELDGPAERGSRGFRIDRDLPVPARAKDTDYTNSEFDRGHMAPAEDMTRSEKVMAESFLFSNVAPQVGEGFNQQRWLELENATRDWVELRGSLTIIVGPVFTVASRRGPPGPSGRVTYDVVGANHVAVPTAFFKVIVDSTDPLDPEAIAFIMPNEDLSNRTLDRHLVSIDEIERVTGLDLLASLPTDVQDTIEREPAEELWPTEDE